MTMTAQGEMSYRELHDRYIAVCQARNLSEYTVRFYNISRDNFAKFTDIDALKASNINERTMTDYARYLRARKLRDVTVSTYVRGVMPVMRYAMETGDVKPFKTQRMKSSYEAKQGYTDDELELLLRKPSKSSFAEYRNWVIDNTLIGTGVRALELRSLTVKDVDLSQGMLLVNRTKNRRPRYVPLSKTLAHILADYLRVRKAKRDDAYLFCNEFGQFMPRSTLQMAVTKYCLKRGVKKYSLHLFRHTFAKKWILNGGDVFSLQKLLGHSSLKMVGVYVNLFGSDLKRGFDSYCALEGVSAGKVRERVAMR